MEFYFVIYLENTDFLCFFIFWVVFGLFLKFFFLLMMLFTSLLCNQSSRSASHLSCLRPLWGEERWVHGRFLGLQRTPWVTGASSLPWPIVTSHLPHKLLLICCFPSVFIIKDLLTNKQLGQERNKCSKDFLFPEHSLVKEEQPVNYQYQK